MINLLSDKSTEKPAFGFNVTDGMGMKYKNLS